ncbi:MAG TPA: DUF1223 domain-containing protein, partial [Thermoanaerobaculia bacterium]
MTTRRPVHALSAALLAVTLACCAPGTPLDARADESAPSADEAGAEGPVLVELFTSQGCSSCPPADRLLTELGSDRRLANRVLPLAYHVDYWNHIGWTDPFSAEAWSVRQRRYARAWESRRVYTPQLVVDGRKDVVGSRKGDVYDLVREALDRPDAARVAVRLSPGSEPTDLRATVTAEMLSTPEGQGPLDLMVALYEKDLTTSVERGENADRTLHNDYVVRRLERAGELAARVGASLEEEVAFELDPAWKVRDLGVVAFVQDPETRAVHGAARATLAVIE